MNFVSRLTKSNDNIICLKLNLGITLEFIRAYASLTESQVVSTFRDSPTSLKKEDVNVSPVHL